MSNQFRPFTSFMDFGFGYNSATDDIRGQAVSGGAVKSAGDGKNDGQTVAFHVHSVSSMSDVKQSLGVSVEAGAVFLGGGGSASFQFSESSSLHSFSAYLLVSSFVTNASTHMLGEQLSGPANALISNGHMDDRFVEEFGDLYIKGIETGGTFFATIEVQTTDSTDQTSVAASLSVNAFVGGGAESLKSHFNSESMQSLSTHHLEINSLQVSGKGHSAKQFLTVDEMLAAASDFATTVADHPVPYRAELQDYRALDLPAPPNAAELQNAKDVLADCGARREAWLQYRNDIAYIVANPAQFETPPVALSVLDQESATALNQIKTSASTCLNAIKSCAFTSASLPDRSKLPNRKSTSGDADSQANRGAALARLDPLALAIRNSLPKLVQHGFDLGMAIAEGQTLLGPGKQGFIDTLPTPDEKHGCEIGVDYSVDRNRNSVLAQAGRAVASAHPTVQRARDAEPPGLFTLGFDIATGIFGDPNPTFPEPHALGHTLDGPGAQKILADLTSEVQRGFKVSRDLNLGPPPLRT